MGGTLTACGNILKDAVLTITGLHASWLWPDSVLPPHVIIVPGSGAQQSFDGAVDRQFTVYLLGAPAQDGTYRGQDACIPYMEETGDKSVRAALEAVDEYSVKASVWHNFDALKTWQGRVFWGAVCEIEVLD